MQVVTALSSLLVVSLAVQTSLAYYRPLAPGVFLTDHAAKMAAQSPFPAGLQDDEDSYTGGGQVAENSFFTEAEKALLVRELAALADGDESISLDLGQNGLVLENVGVDIFDMDDDVTDIIEYVTSDPLLQSCSHGECTFCFEKGFKLCLTFGLDSKQIGIYVVVKINGHEVFKKELSVANPPPICLNNIPYVKKFANICFQVYDLNLKSKSACAKVTIGVKVGPLKKKFNWKIGCFHLPVLDDQTQDLRLLY